MGHLIAVFGFALLSWAIHYAYRTYHASKTVARTAAVLWEQAKQEQVQRDRLALGAKE